MKVRTTKNKVLLIGFRVVFFILLQIAVSVLDKKGLRSFNGVLMAFQFVMCLIIVRVDYRIGTFISLGLMSFSILNVAIVMLITKQLGPLPGLCNMILYVVTLTLLSRQFFIRDKEAVTDVLTGLLNRRGLYQKIEAKIVRDKSFYVLYINLWNFKVINDNYGHAYGDKLLKLVTARILASVEDIKKDVNVARIGGNEFVLVLDGSCDVAAIAKKVLHKISEKADVVTDNFIRIDSYLTTYAGISKYMGNAPGASDAQDAESMIRCADIAMYHASKQEKMSFCFFDRDMGQQLAREMELEKLIKEGLEKDYFYLVYQPQYKIEDKKLRGFEALLRMKIPKGETVSPAEFIPVAEKGDLILQIDDYVLRRAMREFKDIVEKMDDELTISVNVSAKNIGAKGFADKVKVILEETKFRPESLEIEITEYCMVESVEITIENIMQLRALGVQVALDDFGTGYTSLSYLAKMPINLLKVDKSLVDDIVANEKSRDFVTAVIAMGHLMGCEVISEGVESEDQLKVLNGQECDFVQGYVWGRPLDYAAAKKIALGA